MIGQLNVGTVEMIPGRVSGRTTLRDLVPPKAENSLTAPVTFQGSDVRIGRPSQNRVPHWLTKRGPSRCEESIAAIELDDGERGVTPAAEADWTDVRGERHQSGQAQNPNAAAMVRLHAP